MTDCLFCKIRDKEIKSDIIYEDKEVLAFKDINPQAPIHILVIPKKHIASLSDLDKENSYLVGMMVMAAKKIAEESNIKNSGYRLVFNCGPDAGQAVFHIHLHLLGGRSLGWPPG
jgi:histidine triad (HIT) family protein